MAPAMSESVSISIFGPEIENERPESEFIHISSFRQVKNECMI